MKARDWVTAVLIGAVGWGVLRGSALAWNAAQWRLFRGMAPPDGSMFLESPAYYLPVTALAFAALVAVLLVGRKAIWLSAIAALVAQALMMAGSMPDWAHRAIMFALMLTVVVSPVVCGLVVQLALRGVGGPSRDTGVTAGSLVLVGGVCVRASMVLVMHTGWSLMQSGQSWQLGQFLTSSGVTIAWFGGGILIAVLLGLAIWRALDGEHRSRPVAMAAIAILCGLQIGLGTGIHGGVLGISHIVLATAAPLVALMLARHLSGKPGEHTEAGHEEGATT